MPSSIISTSNSSWGVSTPGSQANKQQGIVKQHAADLARGTATPNERIATAAVVRLSQAGLVVSADNVIRGSNVLSQAISDLNGVMQQYVTAQSIASQIAGGVKTTDEIAILNTAFTQAMSGADVAAKNSNLLGFALLSSANGTSTAATAVAANCSGTTAPAAATFDINSANILSTSGVTVTGNIFGQVQNVSVTASGGTGNYNVTLTMVDPNTGKTYSLSNSGVQVTNSGVVVLTSSLDDVSTISFAFNSTASGNLTTAAKIDANLTAAFAGVGGSATVFKPDVGTLTGGGTGYTINVATGTAGTGNYYFTQNPADLTQLTVFHESGASQTVTLTAGATFYPLGVAVTTGATWSNTALTSDHNNNFISYSLGGGGSGFSQTINIGSQSVSYTIPSQTGSGLGVSSLTANTSGNALTASTTLTATIKLIAQTLGNLQAIQNRLDATLDTVQASQVTYDEVLGSIQNVDLITTTQDLAAAKIQQMMAIQNYVGELDQRDQVMSALQRALA